jgi:hypothetical protein
VQKIQFFFFSSAPPIYQAPGFGKIKKAAFSCSFHKIRYISTSNFKMQLNFPKLRICKGIVGGIELLIHDRKQYVGNGNPDRPVIRTRRILLMDDEEKIREVTKHMLVG